MQFIYDIYTYVCAWVCVCVCVCVCDKKTLCEYYIFLPSYNPPSFPLSLSFIRFTQHWEHSECLGALLGPGDSVVNTLSKIPPFKCFTIWIVTLSLEFSKQHVKTEQPPVMGLCLLIPNLYETSRKAWGGQVSAEVRWVCSISQRKRSKRGSKQRGAADPKELWATEQRTLWKNIKKFSIFKVGVKEK
jgi:hypothetical protein